MPGYELINKKDELKEITKIFNNGRLKKKIIFISIF